MVISEHPSETLPTYEFSVGHRRRELGLNELVLKPLMVSFAAIVFNVIGDGSAERAFSDENESVQAFLFDTANESLRKCIQIGRTRWKPEALNTCRLKQDAELFSVER